MEDVHVLEIRLIEDKLMHLHHSLFYDKVSVLVAGGVRRFDPPALPVITRANN